MNTASNTNTDTPVVSSDRMIAIEIKDIKVNNVPQNPLNRHKHYVQLDIGGNMKVTGKSEKVTDPVWADRFSFDIMPLSVLVCRLYQSSGQIGRGFRRSDKVIGELRERFDLSPGEHLKVFQFHKPGEGGSALGATTIQFSVSVLPKDSSIVIPAISMPVDSASQGILDVAPTLELAESSVRQMKAGPMEASSTLETAVNIVTSDSFSASCDALVNNIKVFTGMVDKLAEIHRYTKAAWAILSVFHKTVIEQIEHDDKITNLVQDMGDVYGFLKETKPSEYHKQQKEVITLLAKQTTECAYFVRDYTSTPSFWKRAGKNLISDSDQKIQSYQDKFKSLKKILVQL